MVFTSVPLKSMTTAAGDRNDELDQLLTVQQVLQSHPFRGINRKVQLKPIAWAAEGEAEVPTEALFILKWGGELTALGVAQARAPP